jgi:thymidylate synthase
MVAKITNLEPHEFVHSLADSHIYLNHVEAVRAQLERDPLPLPQLQITDRGQQTIDDFLFDDFELLNYQSHKAIRAEMAV